MERTQFRKWNIALTCDDTTTLLCRIPGCLCYCVIAPSCRIPGAHMMVWELPCCRIPGAPHFARSFIISLLLPGAGGAGLSCAAGEKTTPELQLNTSPPPTTHPHREGISPLELCADMKLLMYGNYIVLCSFICSFLIELSCLWK